ncbi:MAG TPA: hypothetical protein VN454_05270 [Candidatus Angelobacter sp.]|nr:hypothetical protein [Candidatus Angelobacter sp.]
MREAVKRFLKRRVLPFFLVFLAAFAFFVAVFVLKCAFVKPAAGALLMSTRQPGASGPDIGEKNRRPVEDAYYSYPEWYIVWSYEARAQYLPKNLPSGFPYFASIGQYWRSYCFICGLTQSRHQFNFGDHLSSFVLGGSFALEYSIRGAYEQTIGRLSEWTSSHELVEEDAYAARVAREYADFVYIRPFYEFHFAHALKEFWKETPLWGKHPIRKWERKFILSMDYGLEALYAWVLEKASHLTYGVESADTYTWIENAPETLFQEFPRIKAVKEVSSHSYVVAIPRYQEFTDLAMKLAKHDVHFAEIAGNGEIMLTIVAPKKWSYDLPATDGTLLFTENFLTQPGLERIALECPVRSLHAVLNNLASRGAQIEHIYDY